MKRTEAGSGNLKEHFKRNWPYYVMMLPGIIYLVMFKYIPMLGSVIAFKDYSAYKGIWDSAWCGLTNFKKLFTFKVRILKFSAKTQMLNEIQGVKAWEKQK